MNPKSYSSSMPMLHH